MGYGEVKVRRAAGSKELSHANAAGSQWHSGSWMHACGRRTALIVGTTMSV
jgi:hypothetical protein